MWTSKSSYWTFSKVISHPGAHISQGNVLHIGSHGSPGTNHVVVWSYFYTLIMVTHGTGYEGRYQNSGML